MRAFPCEWKLKRWCTLHPSLASFTHTLASPPTRMIPDQCLGTCWTTKPPSAQSPFARGGRYPPSGRLQEPPQKTLLLLHRSYGLMRQTKSLPVPRDVLVHRVFAGCHQSLLGDGPSRYYLCNPCIGAWTHTPPRSSDAFTHFFSENTGLTLRETSSARERIPVMQLQQGA